MNLNDKIIIYRTDDGQTAIDVKLEHDTVWLSQAQMAELFQKDRTVIGRHINNIYKEHELERETTCANFAHVGKDADQTYQTVLYNLDVIISVGYRVKSQRGTQFRIWANRVLKEDKNFKRHIYAAHSAEMCFSSTYLAPSFIIQAAARQCQI